MANEETTTITVVGGHNCPKCATAVRLLKEADITFMHYNMEDLDQSARLNYMNMAKDAGQRGLPIILKNDTVVKLEDVINEN